MEKKATKNVMTVRIKTDAEKPMDIDLIAESIKAVADNIEKALSSGLTMKGICVLIQDSMTTKEKIPIRDIQNVLIYAANLRRYVNK